MTSKRKTQKNNQNGPLYHTWDAQEGAIVRIDGRRFRVRLHENEVMLRCLDGESFWISFWDQDAEVMASIWAQLFI